MISQSIALSTIFVRHPNLIFTDMGGELVMLNIERGEYYGLNSIGARIWELLEKPTSILSIINIICSEYEIDDSSFQPDIERFITELKDRGLILEG